MDLPFAFVIGRDLASVVERTGAGVTRFDGRQSSFAELAAVREDLLYALPDPVDFAAMAALAHSGLTACLGIERIGGLSPGPVVLVNRRAGTGRRAVAHGAAGLG